MCFMVGVTKEQCRRDQKKSTNRKEKERQRLQQKSVETEVDTTLRLLIGSDRKLVISFCVTFTMYTAAGEEAGAAQALH